MSVYKEAYHAIALIEQQSKRIYPDACDHGALTRINDDLWKWAKQLFDRYGKKETRKQQNYGTGVTITSEIEVMEEWRTGDTEIYKLTYVGVNKGIKVELIKDKYDGYFEIELIKRIPNKSFNKYNYN